MDKVKQIEEIIKRTKDPRKRKAWERTLEIIKKDCKKSK